MVKLLIEMVRVVLGKQVSKFNKARNKLNEQNINRKTIAMLSYLNMEYLLNEEQKLLMKKLHESNEKKIEKEKMTKYI